MGLAGLSGKSHFGRSGHHRPIERGTRAGKNCRRGKKTQALISKQVLNHYVAKRASSTSKPCAFRVFNTKTGKFRSGNLMTQKEASDLAEKLNSKSK